MKNIRQEQTKAHSGSILRKGALDGHHNFCLGKLKFGFKICTRNFIPIQGVLYLFGIKSLICFSYSFQNQHLPITITIQCLSSTTTTTTDVVTTVTLCRCQLSPKLLLDLLVQVIVTNWRMWPLMRPPNTNRIGGWLRVLLVLHPSLASSAAPPPMLSLATNPPPPPEPRTAPTLAGHLPAIQAIFTMARSLLSPQQTR